LPFLTDRRVTVCILVIGIALFLFGVSLASEYDVGVYYFPGWHSSSEYWKDLRGEPGSRSPGKAWEDRHPLLGFYPEEESWVAEKHIDWASSYGITFFAYDWYWDGQKPTLDHAINAYLKAKNKSKLKFCLMWANHSEVPGSMGEFTGMVKLWIDRYFSEPTYYITDEKPVVFVFSPSLLDANARRFNASAKALIDKANEVAREKGRKGIFFVAVTNWMRPELSKYFSGQGFSAYTGWNLAAVKEEKRMDYDAMVDTYLQYYEASKQAGGGIPYLIPASPGWDSRPWHGEKAYVRETPTPEKFERMLDGAKRLAMTQTKKPGIIMVMSWNEFGEGAFIEPTVKWQFKYLESIQRVLGLKVGGN
jgi:hypothetical protein